jgi:hypothetical protein
MDSTGAFRPKGNTIVVPAATSAPTGVAGGGPAAGDVTYTMYNSGTVPVALGYGVSAAAAQANAVFPTAGTSQPSIVLAPGTVQVFTLVDGMFFSGITGSGTATVYICPGEGL